MEYSSAMHGWVDFPDNEFSSKILTDLCFVSCLNFHYSIDKKVVAESRS